MKSIRTKIGGVYGNAVLFRNFLDDLGLNDVRIEEYTTPVCHLPYLCYAYNEEDLQIGELLLYLIIRFNSIEDAFYAYKCM